MAVRVEKPVDTQPIRLTVLGLDLAFRSGADPERIKQAANLLEERFREQKSRSQATRSKEIILIFIALGLADELLQLKMKQEQDEERLDLILKKIEKSSQALE